MVVKEEVMVEGERVAVMVEGGTEVVEWVEAELAEEGLVVGVMVEVEVVAKVVD